MRLNPTTMKLINKEGTTIGNMNGKNVKKVRDLICGERFEFQNRELIMVGPSSLPGHPICLFAKPLLICAFDDRGCNDFFQSSLFRLLNETVRNCDPDFEGDDFLPFEIYSYSDDGSLSYQSAESYPFGLLRTFDYRLGRSGIPLFLHTWWTMTPYTTLIRDFRNRVMVVNAYGTLEWADAREAHHVHPACKLRPNLEVQLL